jgi:hypothetical protein
MVEVMGMDMSEDKLISTSIMVIILTNLHKMRRNNNNKKIYIEDMPRR